MKTKCWAHTQGNCSNKISREHLVSKNLLQETVKVWGLDWCQGEPKEIGINSIVTKNLCTSHNSLLSVLDSHAGKSQKEILRWNRITQFRSKISQRKRTKWFSLKIDLDGDKLERWVLKTTVNYLTCGSYQGIQNWQPSENIIQRVFNNYPLGKNCGLGMIVEKNSYLELNEKFEFSLLRQNGNIAGGLFNFMGIPFVCTWDTPVQEVQLPGTFFPEKNKTIIYHCEKLREPNLKIYLNFKWKS